MGTSAEIEPKSVMETRLTHETHRVVTTLLTEAADRPSVPPEALAQLRDFVVANLRHHHEVEDDLLWPLIAATAPEAGHALDGLGDEHKRLDAALDRLAAVDMTGLDAAGLDAAGPDAAGIDARPAAEVRRALREAAVAVRDTVHEHLAHEDPVLLPALRDHVTSAQWDEFAQRVIASAPSVAGHLMIGLLDEVGTAAEVEAIMMNLPPSARAVLPALRDQAIADLRVLRGDTPPNASPEQGVS